MAVKINTVGKGRGKPKHFFMVLNDARLKTTKFIYLFRFFYAFS